jgi:hypothetical protein
MTSPTFVARFKDGIVTKMTTHCAPGKLDLRRGIVLSRIAYRSRTGNEPPPIAEARFQTPENGELLREYDDKEIADATGAAG